MSSVVRCYIVRFNFQSPEDGEITIERFDRSTVEVNDQVPAMCGLSTASVRVPFGNTAHEQRPQMEWVAAVVVGDEACRWFVAKILRDRADFCEVVADSFAASIVQDVDERSRQAVEANLEAQVASFGRDLKSLVTLDQLI